MDSHHSSCEKGFEYILAHNPKEPRPSINVCLARENCFKLIERKISTNRSPQVVPNSKHSKGRTKRKRSLFTGDEHSVTVRLSKSQWRKSRVYWSRAATIEIRIENKNLGGWKRARNFHQSVEYRGTMRPSCFLDISLSEWSVGCLRRENCSGGRADRHRERRSNSSDCFFADTALT